ncbi:MAG: tetratricopeptide repeat protein [Planctomycetia bacterium]|nr:tetratricopeptide repeat protein [Planctomycetia bacterium]
MAQGEKPSQESNFRYDFFISYAHRDNVPQDGQETGFVTQFKEKLVNNEEYFELFGRKPSVFFDENEIQTMDDWNHRIQEGLKLSRFMLVMLSPNYFQSKYCAMEFDWWTEHEVHRFVLGEGTASLQILELPDLYQPDLVAEQNLIPPDILQEFPNWLRRLNTYQRETRVNLHPLQVARIDEVLKELKPPFADKYDKMKRAEACDSKTSAYYPSYNPHFVGRREDILKLRDTLTHSSRIAISAVQGLGGIGKTELALTYGHAFAWNYELGKYFLRCENITNGDLLEAILSLKIDEKNDHPIEQKGNSQERFEKLLQNLEVVREQVAQENAKRGIPQDRGKNALIILDNVSDAKLVSPNMTRLLPPFLHVIVTTRLGANLYTHIQSQQLGKLSFEESLQLLESYRSFDNEAEKQAAEEIARLLDGFTLAVELVGGYMRCNGISYTLQNKIIQRDCHAAFDKMAKCDGVQLLHQTECIRTVLAPTLESLTPLETAMLRLATFMSPDVVGLDWLDLAPTFVPEMENMDEAEQELETQIAKNRLISLNLLTPTTENSSLARLHRLVASCVETPPEVSAKMVASLRSNAKFLLEHDASFWFKPGRISNLDVIFGIYEQLYPQCQETCEEEIDWNLTWTFSALGDLYQDAGNFESALKAKEIHRQIAEKWRETFPKSVSVLRDLSTSYGRLGDLHLQYWNFTSAEDYYKKKLKTCLQMGKNACRELSFCYFQLGDLELKRKNYPSARVYLEKCLQMRAAMADSSDDNLKIQRESSLIYDRMGYLEEQSGNLELAKKYWEHCFEIRSRLVEEFPERDDLKRDMCLIYDRLGTLALQSNHLDIAREYFEKDLAISRQLVENMPESPKALRDLGFSYHRLGKLESQCGNIAQAKKHYTECLNIRRSLAKKGEKNIQWQRDLADTLGRMGDLYASQGEMHSALNHYEESLEIRRRLAEKDQNNISWLWDFGIILSKIGEVYSVQGNIESAVRYYEESLEIRRRLAKKDTNNVQWQCALVVSLYKLSTKENLTEALGILERLKAEGKLPADKEEWISLIQKDLDALKNPSAEMPEQKENE